MARDDSNGRREFLKLAAAAIAATAPGAALAQTGKAVARPAPAAQKAAAVAPERGAGTFFTRAELALVDEVAEMIIPADARSGGARAAGVAAFIDARLAESRDPVWRQSWKDDLAEIDRLSREMFGRRFLEATGEQRARLLTRISRREADPKEPGEYAFGTIKWTVAETYYRTRIGIHDEIGYVGNTIQTEFTGVDVGNRPVRP